MSSLTYDTVCFTCARKVLTIVSEQFVGLDTLHNITTGWREERVSTGEIHQAAVEEVPILTKLVKEGKLGRKSGEGFFKCA